MPKSPVKVSVRSMETGPDFESGAAASSVTPNSLAKMIRAEAS